MCCAWQTRRDQLGVEMRERITWDIREGVIGSENFFPKHAITITWKNMSFAGGIDNSLFTVRVVDMGTLWVKTNVGLGKAFS